MTNSSNPPARPLTYSEWRQHNHGTRDEWRDYYANFHRRGIKDTAAAEVAREQANLLLYGTSEPERRYTRQEVHDAIGAGANMAQEHDYETSDTIASDDAVNLAANAARHLLDHPGDGLIDVILANYSDVKLNEDDFADGELAAGDDGTLLLPKKGSPEWQAALVGKVLGWLA